MSEAISSSVTRNCPWGSEVADKNELFSFANGFVKYLRNFFIDSCLFKSWFTNDSRLQVWGRSTSHICFRGMVHLLVADK